MPEISAADARKRSSVRTDLLSTKRHRINLIRNWPLGSGRDGERIARLPGTIRPPNIRRLRFTPGGVFFRRVASLVKAVPRSRLAENEDRARSSRSFPTRFAVVAFETIAKREKQRRRGPEESLYYRRTNRIRWIGRPEPRRKQSTSMASIPPNVNLAIPCNQRSS